MDRKDRQVKKPTSSFVFGDPDSNDDPPEAQNSLDPLHLNLSLDVEERIQTSGTTQQFVAINPVSGENALPTTNPFSDTHVGEQTHSNPSENDQYHDLPGSRTTTPQKSADSFQQFLKDVAIQWETFGCVVILLCLIAATFGGVVFSAQNLKPSDVLPMARRIETNQMMETTTIPPESQLMDPIETLPKSQAIVQQTIRHQSIETTPMTTTSSDSSTESIQPEAVARSFTEKFSEGVFQAKLSINASALASLKHTKEDVPHRVIETRTTPEAAVSTQFQQAKQISEEKSSSFEATKIPVVPDHEQALKAFFENQANELKILRETLFNASATEAKFSPKPKSSKAIVSPIGEETPLRFQRGNQSPPAEKKSSIPRSLNPVQLKTKRASQTRVTRREPNNVSSTPTTTVPRLTTTTTTSRPTRKTTTTMRPVPTTTVSPHVSTPQTTPDLKKASSVIPQKRTTVEDVSAKKFLGPPSRLRWKSFNCNNFSEGRLCSSFGHDFCVWFERNKDATTRYIMVVPVQPPNINDLASNRIYLTRCPRGKVLLFLSDD